MHVTQLMQFEHSFNHSNKGMKIFFGRIFRQNMSSFSLINLYKNKGFFKMLNGTIFAANKLHKTKEYKLL